MRARMSRRLGSWYREAEPDGDIGHRHLIEIPEQHYVAQKWRDPGDLPPQQHPYFLGAQLVLWPCGLPYQFDTDIGFTRFIKV